MRTFTQIFIVVAGATSYCTALYYNFSIFETVEGIQILFYEREQHSARLPNEVDTEDSVATS